MKRLIATTTLAAAIGLPGLALAESPQGVSADAIKIGTYSDLSGPLAAWGVATRNGLQLRFDELNAAGGVHGRKIRFLVEDMQYQVPRAVQAANKLLRKDKVFLLVGALGTPMNNAVLPRQLKRKIPNVFPFSAATSMSVPMHRLKFTYFRSYFDQFYIGVKYFKQKLDYKKPCLAQVANDAGEDMAAGAKAQLAKLGLKLAAHNKHKVRETNFVSTVTSLRNAKCDIVFLATSIKDTILIVATAKKMGWKVPFVTGMVPYIPLVAEAAGGAMEGLYTVSPYRYVYEDEAKGQAAKIMAAYKKKFGKAPSPQAQLGYVFGDIVVQALSKAGRNLTTDSFVKSMESIKGYRDPFGGPSVSFSPTDRDGVDNLIVAQVQGKRWKVVATGLE